MKKTPVIAIGLDAAEPSVMEKWMAEGRLKTMSRLRSQGIYGRLQNFAAFSAETPWTTFASGCRPHKTGYWSPLKMRAGTYEMETRAAYEYDEFPPFYALGSDYKVAAFDMPQVRLTPQVNGPQVAAWGAHSPQIPSGSLPESLFQELIERHGEHPGLHKDYAICPDIKGTLRLRNMLEVGIERRAAICKDLLSRDNWDLFITVFGEAHAAGHNFWQLSQPEHPLYEALHNQVERDPMLETFENIDKAIGEILTQAPENARVVIFSAHGMGANTMDLPSTVFLPEFLYRLNFPGQYALAPGQVGAPIPPPITQLKWNFWERHLWGNKFDKNALRSFLRRETPTRVFRWIESLIDKPQPSDLTSPFQMLKKTDVVPLQVAHWYAPLWPSMKAFALPSFSEGYVRINLQGRDPQGIVPPSEYDAYCEELIAKIGALKDARTGIPMAQEIVRMRKSADDNNPKLPDADIAIVWQEEQATDVVESPDVGRIGPVPHYRAGSHRPQGFIIATGPGVVQDDTTLPVGHALDIPPTILELMGAPIPEYLEGKPLSILEEESLSV
ncbi:MAG: alkaline phosphatase family protein [Jaaginema sp. PMC 1079.18]|nr:alkaline phosphatase family protein [Jaaginema sp. PMC 1080.18]MEC4852053.1 alkaline phosphatase family protein [Jaaginema sp. PMC 1079.18]MEC4868318.1 alkaline phosphatase family protein [Jaaginema sp. PMC 1078.18]